MENLICEKCEQETEKLFPITTADYVFNTGSWCKDCTDNFDPADYMD